MKMINVKFQNVKCKLIKAKNCGVHWVLISLIILVGWFVGEVLDQKFWLAHSHRDDAGLKTLVFCSQSQYRLIWQQLRCSDNLSGGGRAGGGSGRTGRGEIGL